MKITGANAFGSSTAMSVPQSSDPGNQDSLVECKRVETSSTPGFVPVVALTGTECVSVGSGDVGTAESGFGVKSLASDEAYKASVADEISFGGPEPTNMALQNDDDEAFLDLLVDTLDGEFDPNLL